MMISRLHISARRNNRVIDCPFRRLAEEEFYTRIDKGIAELDAGLGEDSDMMDKEIADESGVIL